jgi:alkylation response protein AidB-like acyl-CoA dehydrogenase
LDVRLSSEQRALADSVAQVAGHLGPRTVAALDDHERAAKLDAAVAAAGWRDLRTAAAGGPWGSGVEVAIVAEELARASADTPFIGPTLAAELRRLAGAPPATSAETVLLTSDLGAVAHGGEGGVAVDAAGAESAVVVVPAASGYTLAAVAVSSGVATRASGDDLTRPAVAVAPGTPVSEVAGQSRSISEDSLAQWTALGLATASADLVGAMRGASDLTVEYARQRRQFGRPIGSFQAVQHLLADAAVHLEGSRSTALYAAWAVDALPPADALGAAAAAKAYTSRAALAVCEIGIQVHGGIGNTWDCFAHVYLRRSLLAIDVLGGVGPNLARVLEYRGIGGERGLQ